MSVLTAALWLATAGTMASAVLAGVVMGWVLGYQHARLIAWGVTRARLRSWYRKHRRRAARAYPDVFRDIRRLLLTGRWT